MKTLLPFLVAAVLLIVAVPGQWLAHRAIRVVTGGKYVMGEVIAVHKVGYGQGRRHGIQLLLKTATGRVAVNLGPSWFLEGQAMKVMPHDMIKVAGSRITCEGKATLIATVIKKGNERMRLRAADGTPLWLMSRTR